MVTVNLVMRVVRSAVVVSSATGEDADGFNLEAWRNGSG
jgi:hypothetical protein